MNNDTIIMNIINSMEARKETGINFTDETFLLAEINSAIDAMVKPHNAEPLIAEDILEEMKKEKIISLDEETNSYILVDNES